MEIGHFDIGYIGNRRSIRSSVVRKGARSVIFIFIQAEGYLCVGVGEISRYNNALTTALCSIEFNSDVNFV